jgi:hypothetical protein
LTTTTHQQPVTTVVTTTEAASSAATTTAVDRPSIVGSNATPRALAWIAGGMVAVATLSVAATAGYRAYVNAQTPIVPSVTSLPYAEVDAFESGHGTLRSGLPASAFVVLPRDDDRGGIAHGGMGSFRTVAPPAPMSLAPSTLIVGNPSDHGDVAHGGPGSFATEAPRRAAMPAPTVAVGRVDDPAAHGTSIGLFDSTGTRITR